MCRLLGFSRPSALPSAHQQPECVLSPASGGYPAQGMPTGLAGKVGILVGVSKQAGFFLVGEVQRIAFISAF